MWPWGVVWSVLAVGVLTYVLLVLFWARSSREGTSIDDFIIADDVADQPSGQLSGRPATPQSPGKLVLVLYATEYGFSEEVGVALVGRLAEAGYQPRLLSARDHERVQWPREQAALCVFSTSGDGVPPTDSWPFMEYLSQGSPDLSHLHFSVLGLGDSNYPHFCRCGRTLHSRLEALGAHCIAARVDVDQEDWQAIGSWMGGVVSGLQGVGLQSRSDYLILPDSSTEEGFSRTRPFMATLTGKHLLTQLELEGDKETTHVEFDIAGSGLTYFPGDALGLYPINNPPEVEGLLAAMGCMGTEEVQPPHPCHQRPEPCHSLRDALLYCYDLRKVRGELVQVVVDSCVCQQERERGQQLLSEGLSKKNRRLAEYLETHEIVDLLSDFRSHTIPYANLLAHMKSLQPRYYSIASAAAENQNCAAVCVAVVRYQLAGLPRTGVASTFLQDRLRMGSSCPIFISHNPDFRLPSGETPIIMIGPGTGIAPFRAFLQERALTGATGKNLLYFGCRHAHKDFLYRQELEQYQLRDRLQLRVAFSRDQREKVYVQHLIMEDSHSLWHLLQAGAHVYVCGDARGMAGDVHQALLHTVQSQAHCSAERAVHYLKQLEEQHRYQKDVWVI